MTGRALFQRAAATCLGRATDAPGWLGLAQALSIVVVAIVVRSVELGRQSLWTDELFSRYYPDLFSTRYLWTTGLAHENSPPLYYTVLEGWMRLFGTSATALRSLSLLASVLTLPLLYLLGKELFDRRRALLAALILALLPMQIEFAQDARTYALLLIPIGTVLLAIARLLRGDVRARVLWPYGIGAVVALYCHATAAFLIAACNIVVVPAIAADRGIDRRDALLRWIGANTLVGVVAVPALAGAIVQARTGSGIGWIPPFRPVDIVRALSPAVVGDATPAKFPGAELSFGLLGLLAAALLAIRPSRRIWIVTIAIAATYVALIAAASLFRPIFIARSFCWLDIPLALLLAHALATPWRLRPALAAVAVMTGATALYYQFAVVRNEPWRDVAEQLGPQLARADHVVLAPLTDPTGLDYYAPYLTHLEKWNVGPRQSVENGALPSRMHVHWVSGRQVADEVRSGGNVWLIMRTPDKPYVDPLLAMLPPPAVRLERSCDKVVCLAALSWYGEQKQRPR